MLAPTLPAAFLTDIPICRALSHCTNTGGLDGNCSPSSEQLLAQCIRANDTFRGVSMRRWDYQQVWIYSDKMVVRSVWGMDGEILL